MTAVAKFTLIVTGIIVVANYHGLFQTARGTELSVKEAMAQYKATLSPMENVSFNSRWTERVSDAVLSEQCTEEWKVDLKERRLWCKSKTLQSAGKKVDSAKNGGPTTVVSVYERILTADQMSQISVDEESGFGKQFTSYLSVPSDYWETKSRLGYSSFPLGFIQLNDSYLSILSLLDNDETSITNGEEVVLERSSDDFTLTVKLLPEKGWVARYVRLTSGEGSNLNSISFEVDQFEKIGQGWFPVAYRCDRQIPPKTTTLPKGIRIKNGVVTIDQSATKAASTLASKRSRSAAEVQISGVRFDKLRDSSFEFQTIIPQGSPVSMQDALHLSYFWLDGMIVPASDALPRLKEDHRFYPGVASGRWLLLGIASLLLFGILIRRWMNGRS